MRLFSASLFWLCHIVCVLIAVADASLRGSEGETVGDLPPSPQEQNSIDRTSTVFTTQPKYPFSAVGKVITPNWNCTGVMVGPSLMLTSQWCIKSKPGSLTVESLLFVPAYYQGDYMGTAKAEDYFYDYEIDFTEHLTAMEAAFDYVVVKLDNSIGNNVGYWQPREYNVQWNGGEFWSSIGYSHVQSGESPFSISNIPIDSVSSHTLSDGTEAYLMQTSSIVVWLLRQSGCPMFGFLTFESSVPDIIGIISNIAQDDSHSTIAGGPGMVAQIAELRQTYG